MLVIIMCICFEKCTIKHNYTWRMTESFNTILKWRTKNKNMNIICEKCWRAHKQTAQRAAGDMIKTTHLMQNMSSRNMLLPGVIWSNRGPIVALWFDHANHHEKKEKASMNRSVCVSVCRKRSLQCVSVKLSTFKQFLGILLGIKAAPSVWAITLKFKLCVRCTCVREEYKTACV